jgi:cell division protein FtsB
VAAMPQIEMIQSWMKRVLASDQNPSVQKKHRRRLAFFLALAMLLYMIFGGDQGLFSLASSWHETWALKHQIADLQESNKELEAKALALVHDHDYYEKIAREKLLLQNPGDLIYRFDGK